jgi:perosamine synthetase
VSVVVSVQEFLGVIRSVVGDGPRVGLHEPDISALEHEYVKECLDSTFVSSVGPFVTRFEQEIAAFTGANYAVAVSNGTSALHVALVLAGVEPGDEVIIPALSFVATANAVSHAGAHPYFVDSEMQSFGMSVAAVRDVLEGFESRNGQYFNPVNGRRIGAIVPMHTLGHPMDIVGLVALADSFGIPVVEDSAESLGSYVGTQHTGTFGKLGMLSFNGNKTITTGGGGMILTNDEEIGARAKHLTTTAKVSHEWLFSHDEVAWNYRLPNLNAALGVAQLSRLPQFLAEKRAIAEAYSKSFEQMPGIRFVHEPPGTSSNYWLCSVELAVDSVENRDLLLKAANDSGIQVRPLWEILSDLPMYVDASRGDLSVARSIQRRVISLPSSPVLARAWSSGTNK